MAVNCRALGTGTWLPGMHMSAGNFMIHQSNIVCRAFFQAFLQCSLIISSACKHSWKQESRSLHFFHRQLLPWDRFKTSPHQLIMSVHVIPARASLVALTAAMRAAAPLGLRLASRGCSSANHPHRSALNSKRESDILRVSAKPSAKYGSSADLEPRSPPLETSSTHLVSSVRLMVERNTRVRAHT